MSKKFKVDYKVEDGKLKLQLSLDINEDGEAVIVNSLEINLSEIPDEIISAIWGQKQGLIED